MQATPPSRGAALVRRTEPASENRPHSTDLRSEISRQVNDLVHQALRRVRVLERVGGHDVNLLLSLRRWQLTFIEGMFVEALLEREMRAPVKALHLGAFRPSRPRRVPFARTWAKARHLALTSLKRVRLRVLSGVKRRLAPPGIRRLLFVDGNEIKVSTLGGRRYVYHKYLEGLVDLDGGNIPDDTLVVLYGDLRDVPWSVLGSPRVTLLAAWSDRRRLAPSLARVSTVALSAWSSCFHGVPMPRRIRDRLSGASRLLEDLMRDDVRLVDATQRLLSCFEGPLDITLDTHDFTLFALSQYLLAHTAHRVTAVQRVLGPYTFSYNIRGHRGLFRLPHRILCWGRFHQACLRRLGYHDCGLHAIGTPRLALYRRFVDEGRVRSRAAVRAALGAPPDGPVVMFSVVAKVLGVPLVDPLRYVEMIAELAALADAGRCFVVFKPWPGEDTGKLEQIVNSCFRRGTFRLVDARLNVRLHNVELLHATDVLVSTMSSFIGEGLAVGTVPILITGRTARGYFSRRYSRLFERFCRTVDEDAPLTATLEPLLTPAAREAFLASLDSAATDVFGDLACAATRQVAMAESVRHLLDG